MGIQLNGTCPGATLENVTVRNMKAAGLKLHIAKGEQSRPILLDHIRVLMAPNTDGVHLNAATRLDTQWVTIRNSRFEGPGRAGIRIEGPAIGIEITGNRFFGNNAAVIFPELLDPSPLQVNVASNTICQAQVGFLFDFEPAEQKGSWR